MKTRRMAATAMTVLDPSLALQISSNGSKKRVVAEEIDGLIKVYKDGFVERLQIMPFAACSLAPELGLSCRDVMIDRRTNTWARFYVPTAVAGKLPLLVYFHGGGFCVGSASWSCYHDFLAKLASKAGCVVVSVDYRLAPESRLPAAYDDGVNALIWLRREAGLGKNEWWADKCDVADGVFLAGDSAGANIAYNVSMKVKKTGVKGLILIQPFFGGESRTDSEMHAPQPPRSALTLAASDTYWRLALRVGADRDHPWCNPLTTRMGPAGLEEASDLRTMVCISEMDILKDRNLELCARLRGGGSRKVEQRVYNGVGHAFQILNKSPLAQIRVLELIEHVKTFVDNTK